jgi:hypothetical protein
MKIEEAIRRKNENTLSPMKRKVLRHLEGHPDEVFPHGDSKLAASLGMKQAALDWTLWWLRKNDYIEKASLDRVYFGSAQAIEELTKKANATNGRRKK